MSYSQSFCSLYEICYHINCKKCEIDDVLLPLIYLNGKITYIFINSSFDLKYNL